MGVHVMILMWKLEELTVTGSCFPPCRSQGAVSNHTDPQLRFWKTPLEHFQTMFQKSCGGVQRAGISCYTVCLSQWRNTCDRQLLTQALALFLWRQISAFWIAVCAALLFKCFFSASHLPGSLWFFLCFPCPFWFWGPSDKYFVSRLLVEFGCFSPG